jgi:hypothetical protein
VSIAGLLDAGHHVVLNPVDVAAASVVVVDPVDATNGVFTSSPLLPGPSLSYSQLCNRFKTCNQAAAGDLIQTLCSPLNRASASSRKFRDAHSSNDTRVEHTIMSERAL